MTVYNNNQKCDSGFYNKSDIEEYVLKEISKLQHDDEYLEELFAEQELSIDRAAYQKQIDVLSNKISKLNDLYIDDRITLDELQIKAAEFSNQRAALEEELDNDPAIKQQKRKEDMKQVLNTDDILTMDYDHQKFIVKSLINKVQVTAEDIVIKWRI